MKIGDIVKNMLSLCPTAPCEISSLKVKFLSSYYVGSAGCGFTTGMLD